MIAGSGELVVEYEGDVFANGQVDRLLRTDSAIDGQADEDSVGARRPEVADDPLDQGCCADGHDRGLDPKVSDGAVLTACPSQIDNHRSRPPGFQLRQRPLEAVRAVAFG